MPKSLRHDPYWSIVTRTMCDVLSHLDAICNRGQPRAATASRSSSGSTSESVGHAPLFAQGFAQRPIIGQTETACIDGEGRGERESMHVDDPRTERMLPGVSLLAFILSLECRWGIGNRIRDLAQLEDGVHRPAGFLCPPTSTGRRRGLMRPIEVSWGTGYVPWLFCSCALWFDGPGPAVCARWCIHLNNGTDGTTLHNHGPPPHPHCLITHLNPFDHRPPKRPLIGVESIPRSHSLDTRRSRRPSASASDT